MSEPQPRFHKLDEFEPTATQNGDLLAHWKSLRHGQIVPLWEAFDPLEIIGALVNCAILEFVSSDHFKVRLFGNNLVDRFGVDITGTNFFDMYEPDQRPGLENRTKILRTRPAVLCSIVAGRSAMGVAVISESMLFPFRGPDGEIGRALLSICEMSTGDVEFLTRPRHPKGAELLKFDVLDL